jgi:signal transduction histidine kinase
MAAVTQSSVGHRRARVVLPAVVGALVVGLVIPVVADLVLGATGHRHSTMPGADGVLYVLGLATAAAVGAAIVRTQPQHPVGWLFLALAGVLVLAPVIEAWIALGVLDEDGTLPLTGVFAAVDNSSWIAWFVLVTLVLLLTPTGTWLSPRWRLLGRIVVGCGSVAFVLSLFRTELDPPYDEIENPLGVPGARWLTSGATYPLLLVVAAGLVASGASLVLRWRRARGDDRRQLLWLAMVVIPLPVFVVGAFAAASAGAQTAMLLATYGFVVLVPVAAGLSITRYHLYDVERIFTKATTYSLLTVVLVGTYAGVVWAGARTAGGWSASPEAAATLGALLAAVIAAPLRSGIQDWLDRRFNRRRYDAVRLIRRELRGEDPATDLPTLLRNAFADPSVTVAYPGAAPDEWFAESGLPADVGDHHVDVRRHGRVVARIGHDPDTVDCGVVVAGGQAAATELDNARLRTELARRLVEVESSRRRIAEAQREERRRVERDLHDGAQQRLLALAFELQSAQLSGDAARMRAALADGAVAAQAAVRDLRALANGLHPAALVDGGLPAALDDLRSHATVPVTLDVTVGRLDPALEFAAWLVIGEAVVNAQKHAGASSIVVGVRHADDDLVLEVRDDGRGGANPAGPGLRGLRDRVEAAGGRLDLASAVGAGTRVRAVIPCAS